MPNLTIYVDRHLAAEVRRYGVRVSEVCQRALRAEADEIKAATATATKRRRAAMATLGQADE